MTVVRGPRVEDDDDLVVDDRNVAIVLQSVEQVELQSVR